VLGSEHVNLLSVVGAFRPSNLRRLRTAQEAIKKSL
jgi:hypothetical protein